MHYFAYTFIIIIFNFIIFYFYFLFFFLAFFVCYIEKNSILTMYIISICSGYIEYFNSLKYLFLSCFFFTLFAIISLLFNIYIIGNASIEYSWIEYSAINWNISPFAPSDIYSTYDMFNTDITIICFILLLIGIQQNIRIRKYEQNPPSNPNVSDIYTDRSISIAMFIIPYFSFLLFSSMYIEIAPNNSVNPTLNNDVKWLNILVTFSNSVTSDIPTGIPFIINIYGI